MAMCATFPVWGQAPPPTITSFSPLFGSVAGGTLVTIIGTNFQQGAVAAFGQNNATQTNFISPTQLTAVTPPSSLNGGEGTVGVFVTNPDNQSATAPNRFTYHLAPVITSVVPNKGSAGQTITINGQFFRCDNTKQNCPGPTISFGSATAPSIFVNNTLLTTVAPANSPGTVNVTATNPDGVSGTLTNGFTYQGLGITSVQPAIGPAAGGATASIYGSNFTAGSTVVFGIAQATNVQVVSGQKITCTTPKGSPGMVNVSVSDGLGGVVTLPQSYTYSNGPIVNSTSPSSGGAGTTVVMSGYNLSNVNNVMFGPWAAQIHDKKPNKLYVYAPTATGTGTVNIVVKNATGTFTVPGGFTYMETILTGGLDDAYPNAPYNETMTVTGGVPPYTWSLAPGSSPFPTGMSLNPSTGQITGSPAPTYGTYTVMIQAADSSSPPNITSNRFTFNVLFGFSNTPVPATYFGMMLFDQSLWPVIPIGALGKGLGTLWPFVEQQKGWFDWSITDQYVADAQSHGVSYYTTNANIPPWAAFDQKTCSYYPGTIIIACTSAVKNQADLKDFMTAFIHRYGSKVQMYELWNEPDVPNDYTGTIPQLVAMTNTVYNTVRTLSPTALISNVSATGEVYQQNYFQAGGQQGFDIFGIHGYPDVGVLDVPEAIVGFKSENIKLLMATLNMTSKPLWDTESSWGGQDANKDPDYRASYAARSLLLHWSVGFQRFYWYGYDSPVWGTLYTPQGGLNEAGTAYGQVENWMLGASMNAPCSSNGGTINYATYTCDLNRTGGYIGRAVWDSTQKCNNGCTTSSYTPDPMFVQYRDIAGNVVPISPGQTIQIGLKPVLLENMNAPPQSSKGAK